jgi:hypothetical protein
LSLPALSLNDSALALSCAVSHSANTLPVTVKDSAFGTSNSLISLATASFAQDPEQRANQEIKELKEQIQQRDQKIAAQQAAIVAATEALLRYTQQFNKQAAEQVVTQEQIQEQQRIIKDLSDKIKIQGEAISQLENERKDFVSSLDKAEKKLQELQAPVTLEISVRYIDVYEDGSLGKDCWSTHLIINGIKHQIWHRKKHISDSTTKDNGPGPRNDKDSTRYDLGREKTFTVTVKKYEKVYVSFGGIAHDDDHTLPESRFTFSNGNGWGTRGTWYTSGKEGKVHVHPDGSKLVRIGSGDSNVEYWAFLSVKQK